MRAEGEKREGKKGNPRSVTLVVLSVSGFRSQWIPDGPDGLGAVL